MIDYCITLLSISIISGTIGTFAAWNQQMFFSHILSHTLLLPPAIAIFFGINSEVFTLPITFAFGIIFALFCTEFEAMFLQNKDAVLILSSLVFTAIAIILGTRSISGENEMLKYIIGDILLISRSDTIIMATLAISTAFYIKTFWKTIIVTSINKKIGFTTFPNAKQVFRAGIMLQAISVIAQTKIIGSMLVSGTTMLPAILARITATSPKQMVFHALTIAMLANFFGFFTSFFLLNIPTSAGITVAYGIIATILLLQKRWLGQTG